MSADWNAGVLISSSWHGLESVEELPDAETMIRRAEQTLAWPIGVTLESMETESGVTVPGQGVVATYADGSRRCHAAVSHRYHYLDPKEWRATVEAAARAGAKPVGAFSLGGEKGRFGRYTSPGGKILATFEIGETGFNGKGRFRNYLNMADSMDQSCSYVAGGSSIRVVCANTFSAWMGGDGAKAAKIRHTGSIHERAEALREAIESHVKGGQQIAELYRDAREVRLAKPDVEEILAELFPAPDKDGRKRSRALNKRAEVASAMTLEHNNEGPTLATVWNAATWTVDRKQDKDGTWGHREGRGGADTLEAMLFGGRGQRVEAVREVMVTILRPDGTEEAVPAHQAAAEGVDEAQIGRSLLGDMLN